MPRITGNKRKTKSMAVRMRLSSQILPRRRSPRENEKPLSLKDETKRTRRRRRRGRRPSRVEGEKGAECLPATCKSEIKRIMTICAGQEDQETSRTADNRTTDDAMKRSLQRKGGNRHEDSGRAQAIAASYKSIP